MLALLLGAVAAGGADQPAAVESGDLPFTGFALGIVLVGAALAFAIGLVLRRRGKA